MSMTERTLGEICDEGGGVIRTGPFGTQLHQSDYKECGVPVVMPKDIVGDKLLEDSIARIGEEDVARLSQHILNEGDIVYGRRGDIGRQALITKKEAGWLCGTGCLRITLGKSALLPTFLHYYLQRDDVIGWIYNQAVGVTMPNLNTGILRSVPIIYPPLSTQRKIAAILSAYDDLIENNTRRIRILEEMAQTIYREWFVNFRFPGHEQVRMVDSPLGRVPEGWGVKRLCDLFDFIGGSQPPKSEHIHQERLGYDRFIQNRDYSSSNHLTYIPESRRNKHCDRLDIMVDKYGEPGKTRFGLAGAYNVALAKLLPHNPLHREWLRGLISEPEFGKYLAGASMAATRASLNSSHFMMDVAVPPNEISKSFQSHMEPILKLLLVYKDATDNLRRTRDLLLPKLISGAVDVSELDIDIKGAA